MLAAERSSRSIPASVEINTSKSGSFADYLAKACLQPYLIELMMSGKNEVAQLLPDAVNDVLFLMQDDSHPDDMPFAKFFGSAARLLVHRDAENIRKNAEVRSYLRKQSQGVEPIHQYMREKLRFTADPDLDISVYGVEVSTLAALMRSKVPYIDAESTEKGREEFSFEYGDKLFVHVSHGPIPGAEHITNMVVSICDTETQTSLIHMDISKEPGDYAAFMDEGRVGNATTSMLQDFGVSQLYLVDGQVHYSFEEAATELMRVPDKIYAKHSDFDRWVEMVVRARRMRAVHSNLEYAANELDDIPFPDLTKLLPDLNTKSFFSVRKKIQETLLLTRQNQHSLLSERAMDILMGETIVTITSRMLEGVDNLYKLSLGYLIPGLRNVSAHQWQSILKSGRFVMDGKGARESLIEVNSQARLYPRVEHGVPIYDGVRRFVDALRDIKIISGIPGGNGYWESLMELTVAQNESHTFAELKRMAKSPVESKINAMRVPTQEYTKQVVDLFHTFYALHKYFPAGLTDLEMYNLCTLTNEHFHMGEDEFRAAILEYKRLGLVAAYRYDRVTNQRGDIEETVFLLLPDRQNLDKKIETCFAEADFAEAVKQHHKETGVDLNGVKLLIGLATSVGIENTQFLQSLTQSEISTLVQRRYTNAENQLFYTTEIRRLQKLYELCLNIN